MKSTRKVSHTNAFHRPVQSFVHGEQASCGGIYHQATLRFQSKSNSGDLAPVQCRCTWYSNLRKSTRKERAVRTCDAVTDRRVALAVGAGFFASDAMWNPANIITALEDAHGDEDKDRACGSEI